MNFFYLSILMLFVASSFQHTCSNTKKDVYPNVKIGELEWMSKNLDVSTFRNGDTIFHADTQEKWDSIGMHTTTPAWCYYNDDPENEKKYGKLYNWYAVVDERGLAPEGWRVATKDDWAATVMELGGLKEAPRKLKSKTGWGGESCNGTDESGFNALPGGARSTMGWQGGTKYKNNKFIIVSGESRGIGEKGLWWAALDSS